MRAYFQKAVFEQTHLLFSNSLSDSRKHIIQLFLSFVRKRFKEVTMANFTRFTVLFSFMTVVFFSQTTFAEINLKAFATAPAFNALKIGNADWALRFFENRKLENMNFSSANNLCVALVLQSRLTEANNACEVALAHTAKSGYLRGARRRKEAEALILSNLAMIGVLSGDLNMARDYAEQASSKKALDREMRANLEATLLQPLATN